MMMCSKCKNVHYCTNECQTANWNDHKTHCQLRTTLLSSEVFSKDAEEAYKHWRKQNSAGFIFLGIALGGPDKDLAIELHLDYLPEKSLGNKFQITFFQKIQSDNSLYVSTKSEREAHILYRENKLGVTYVITCSAFGKCIRLMGVGIDYSFVSQAKLTSDEVVKYLNEGIFAKLLQENEKDSTNFPWQKSPPPCSFTSCTKQGTSICSKCKRASYCSTECQKSHWKVHKKDCKKDFSTQPMTEVEASELPMEKVPLNLRLIEAEVSEIMKRADKLSKSYGMKSFRLFNDLHIAGKDSGDYSELVKLLEKKVGRDRIVHFCVDLVQLFDFDASAVSSMDLRVWGNTHYNQLEYTFRTILTREQNWQKIYLFVQRGITDFGRQMRQRLLASGVDLAGIAANPAPLRRLMKEAGYEL